MSAAFPIYTRLTSEGKTDEAYDKEICELIPSLKQVVSHEEFTSIHNSYDALDVSQIFYSIFIATSSIKSSALIFADNHRINPVA